MAPVGPVGALCSRASSGSHWSLSACWSGRPLWSSGAWAAARETRRLETRRYLGICYLSEAVLSPPQLSLSWQSSSGYLPEPGKLIVAGAAAITWKTVVSGVSAWSALFYIIISIHSVGKLKYIITSPYFIVRKAAPSAGRSVCVQSRSGSA